MGVGMTIPLPKTWLSSGWGKGEAHNNGRHERFVEKLIDLLVVDRHGVDLALALGFGGQRCHAGVSDACQEDAINRPRLQ